MGPKVKGSKACNDGCKQIFRLVGKEFVSAIYLTSKDSNNRNTIVWKYLPYFNYLIFFFSLAYELVVTLSARSVSVK